MLRSRGLLAGAVIFGLAFMAGASRGSSGAGPQVRTRAAAAPAHQNIRLEADYGKIPLYFIPNLGQLDKRVICYVQGSDKALYFTAEGITMALAGSAERKDPPGRLGAGGSLSGADETALKARKPGPSRRIVKLEFVGARKGVLPAGEGETGAVVSYFKGKRADWKAGLPTYSRIIYRELWPGIDLVYRGTANRLKYELVVHPGADPSRIRLAYQGARSLFLDDEGRLNVAFPAGGFRDDAPGAYQEKGGKKINIPLAYELGPGALPRQVDGGRAGRATDQRPLAYGFRIGEYDPSRTLVLDPAILIYCGFVGGAGEDKGNSIAVDGSGNAYVTGGTYSTEATFPATAGPDLTYNGGNYDAFVAKVNAAGNALVYCGYIGGSAYDVGSGIAVDASGNSYIAGTTDSTAGTFPVTVGPDLTHNGGYDDAFVAKVDASGTSLVYCGYIGGSSSDFGCGIAVDASGNAHVTGYTASTAATFPELVGPDMTYNGGVYDAYVAKVNAAGTALLYCGYIGGSGDDYGWGIALDGAGNAYVVGETDSTESTFPVAVGPDLSQNGDIDVFVAKVTAAGASLVYCGYIGGSWSDHGLGIAVDARGNAYVTGYTDSSEITFPVTLGPDRTQNGGFDAFVAKIAAPGTGLTYCGYIGGSSYDLGSSIAVDGSGNAYVTGWTRSTEATFPVSAGPDLTYNDTLNYFDAFVAKINASGTSLVYCGYIGGDSYDYGTGIAVDGAGTAYVTGYTWSKETTFPVTVGPDPVQNGNYDATVAKVLYFDDHLPKHAVGDFDADGRVEAAMDFGSKGIWLYNSSAWTQLSPVNPESLLAADVDGDNVDEIVADLGASGVWLWMSGVWIGLSPANVQGLAVGDTDDDGADEVAGDFGALGLWLLGGGSWTQLSGLNPEFVAMADIQGTAGAEIIADFGSTGLWLWSAGAWTELSGADAEYFVSGKTGETKFLAVDFGPTGLWSWTLSGGWAALSGANAENVIAADTDGGADDEVVGDFGALGLWLRVGDSWAELSGVNAESLVSADVDGDGVAEVAAGFGNLGLWLWNGGVWAQLSGLSPDSMLAGDFYGDVREEIIADFGILGVWLWHDGAWAQISPANPD
jgi:hypothetical protein